MSPIEPFGEHLPLVATLVSLVVVFAVGFWFGERTDAGRRRRGLPTWLRLVVAGMSFGALHVGLFVASFSVPLVDETVVAFAVFVALWLGLPYLASQFVDWETRATERSGQC
ncbi:MAG: hypothetical protein ABEI80_04330 [Haloplanus sp.]